MLCHPKTLGRCIPCRLWILSMHRSRGRKAWFPVWVGPSTRPSRNTFDDDKDKEGFAGYCSISVDEENEEVIVQHGQSLRSLSVCLEDIWSVRWHEKRTLRINALQDKQLDIGFAGDRVTLMALKQLGRLIKAVWLRTGKEGNTGEGHENKPSGQSKTRKAIDPERFYGPDFQSNKQQTRGNKAKLVFVEHSFPRQAMVFSFADQDTENALAQGWKRAKVFSMEYPHNGKRGFFVAGKTSFLDLVLNTPAQDMHFYEIIREDSICRLYFDVEFSKPGNKDLDGEALVEKLIQAVGTELERCFGVMLCKELILELESSTDTKFSRHLIIHLRHNGQLCGFRNNRECGAFVQHVVGLYPILVWNGDKSEQTSFVDTSVYSRNRAFRCYLSSTDGQSVSLQPSPCCKFPFGDKSDDGICKLMEDSFVCPPHVSEQDFCILPVKDVHLRDRSSRSGLGTTIKKQASCHGDIRTGQTMFPFLDSYIQRCASVGRCPATIRTWYIDHNARTITYNITGNRFCHRIGRQHKSNNVCYTVDLNTRCFHQRCYDPDCKGFSSPNIRLPDQVFPQDMNILDLFHRQIDFH